MAVPSIKGSAFMSAVASLRQLVEEGRISPGELEARLEAPDLALIEEKIGSAKWYPVDAYGRIAEVLLDVEGEGRPEYLIERGAAVGRRLIEGGLYQQLDFLWRREGQDPMGDAEQDEQGKIAIFRSQLNLVKSIHLSLFNFGNLRITPDPVFPKRLQLDFQDMDALPKLPRLSFLGFWNEVGRYWRRDGADGLWIYQGVSHSHFVLRMSRDVPEL